MMIGILRAILQALVPLFASLLLITIMISGITMMVAPQKGKEILKNAAISAALFMLGLYLAQSCLPRCR